MPREPERAAPFAEALEAAGAEVVVFAVTRLIPGDPAALAVTRGRIAGGAYAWIAFTSRAAVRALAVPPGALGGGRIAVVGPTTAAAVREAGLPVALEADDARGAGLAAALLAADPALARGGAVCLPQADAAQPDLAAALTAAGARVHVVAVYRTETRAAEELAPLAARLVAGAFDVVVGFSPSQVHALAAAVAAQGAELAHVVPRRVALGPTTAAAFAAVSAPATAVCATPTPAALVAAVAGLARS